MAKKGYWVVCYRSEMDPAVRAEYAKAARPAIESAGGRLLVGGMPAKAHEAGENHTVVLIEFDNLQEAIAAYETDAYKLALQVFSNSAKRDIRIIEGF